MNVAATQSKGLFSKQSKQSFTLTQGVKASPKPSQLNSAQCREAMNALAGDIETYAKGQRGRGLVLTTGSAIVAFLSVRAKNLLATAMSGLGLYTGLNDMFKASARLGDAVVLRQGAKSKDPCGSFKKYIKDRNPFQT